ncbi:hypothetical protein [Thiolapillus sp.]|uniref:hypothetical protein n=2 Tax=Thiolapillus sp. TaxID=2017437 RepID=UPI003AF7E67A
MNSTSAPLEPDTIIPFPRHIPPDYKNVSLEEQCRLDNIALRLAQLGAKTAVIRRYSGWGVMKARAIFSEITGRRPPSGGGHISSVSVIKKSAVVHLHATVFAVTLLNVLSRDSDDLPGEKILEAYEIYCEQVRPQGDVNPAELAKAGPSNNGNWQLLDINCAALIAADLVIQATVLQYCDYCTAWYLRPTEHTIGQLLEYQVSLTLQEATAATQCPMCRIRHETLHYVEPEK